MHLSIDFNTTDEARLSAAARQIGLAPSEWIKRLTLEHLPQLPTTSDAEIAAKLRQWREPATTNVSPDLSIQELFAQWADEDARITPEEQAENDRIYADIEKHGIRNE